MVIENLSRSVGLWLAEGGIRSNSEVTLTNSQPELIKLFHKTLFQNLTPEHRPRIYVYRKDQKEKVRKFLTGVTYRYYIHPLARRPFFIYRVSGVELVKEWRKLVEDVKSKPDLYKFLLQGFFAGEGNIKHIVSANSRVLRISQGKPNGFIEKDYIH